MAEDRSGHEASDKSDKSWIEKIAGAFSPEPKSRDDVLQALYSAADNAVIDRDALSIIEGALRVGDMQVREIMVPRPQMQVIKADLPLSRLLPKIIDSAHSRYPVIGENNDEVLGVLLAKDLLPQILQPEAAGEFSIHQLLRPAMLVPESKRLNVLLREFRENRNHMAIVIDEYGGVAGLVTIEDVLEEIVGDIEDEYDVDEDLFIRKVADNDYIVKALTPIEEFNECFDTDYSDEEFDTIGGLVMQQFGYLPQRNEVTRLGAFQFRILNADNRQIHLLRITSVPAEGQ